MFKYRKLFRLAVVSLVLVAGGVTSTRAQQQQGLTTVKAFLDACELRPGSGSMATSQCTLYVIGLLDGTVMAEARANIPHRYCTRGASYGEVGDALLGFIFSEQTKGNLAILSEPITITFTKFLDARYRC
jgi:hypothetical protein